MSIFYVVAALLIVVGILFVVYPWIVNTRKDEVQVSNVSVIKARIEEIKREAQEGLVNQDEMQQAIDDMKLALVDEQQASMTVSSNSRIGVIVGAIPALLVGAWVYYDANQLSGLTQLTYALNNTQELNNRIVLQPANDVTPQEFQKYALVIRQQLRSKPGDAIGWVWLGRINMTLGQMNESVQAFEKALKIKPNDDDVRVKYAQAAMMSGEEEGLVLAMRQLQYLVQKSPNNREYRLLMTVVAAQNNDKEVAFTNFAIIRDQLDPNSNLYNSLVAQLREMGAPEFLLVFDASNAAAGTKQHNANDNMPNQQGSTDPVPSQVSTVNLEITVDIAEELIAKLPDNGYLIVFAQDASGSTRMPLAVQKMALPQFPILVTLSESDAMIANFALSSAESVMITARISADEDVMPAAGELQGIIDNVKLPVMLQPDDATASTSTKTMSNNTLKIALQINKEIE